MRCPFPGMDPYLEHPALWPDVHNRLIAAIADTLSPRVAPSYYVALERRVYRDLPEHRFLGRPDLTIARRRGDGGSDAVREPPGAYAVEIPTVQDVEESYLEIRDAASGDAVCVVELLSPANKLSRQGRDAYEAKRQDVLQSRTGLVEVDLLRAGESMPTVGDTPPSDYSILVRAGHRQCQATKHTFDLRDPIPVIGVPLRKDEEEVPLDLGAVVHQVYERARFDLRLDYDQPPEPPLRDDDHAWAMHLMKSRPTDKEG